VNLKSFLKKVLPAGIEFSTAPPFARQESAFVALENRLSVFDLPGVSLTFQAGIVN
jgi:hypothetical protein